MSKNEVQLQIKDKAASQMPSVASPDLFDIEPFGQLPDDGLHQAPA